jgi:hypothetical protein
MRTRANFSVTDRSLMSRTSEWLDLQSLRGVELMAGAASRSQKTRAQPWVEELSSLGRIINAFGTIDALDLSIHAGVTKEWSSASNNTSVRASVTNRTVNGSWEGYYYQ